MPLFPVEGASPKCGTKSHEPFCEAAPKWVIGIMSPNHRIILEQFLQHSDVKDCKEQVRQMSAKAAPRERVDFAAAAIR